MRLDAAEKEALKFALSDFLGDVYLFGSRVDDVKRGGDIDLLLVPRKKLVNSLKFSLQVQARFFSVLEERIDVTIYSENKFCKEILKNAKKLDISRI